MIATQFFVLGSDAGGAVIKVADTQIIRRYLQPSATIGPVPEAEAFGADDHRLNNVLAGFEPTVHLQVDFMAQPINYQRLLGFPPGKISRASRCI